MGAPHRCNGRGVRPRRATPHAQDVLPENCYAPSATVAFGSGSSKACPSHPWLRRSNRGYKVPRGLVAPGTTAQLGVKLF